MTEVSVLIPARRAGHSLQSTLEAIDRYLSTRSLEAEIIVVPNGTEAELASEVPAHEALARQIGSRVRVVPHHGAPGKGAALKTGFAAARGQQIWFTDADLPYDLEFFDRARVKLQQGVDFYTGNRRLSTSHFDVPVRLLKLAHGRHQMGTTFNRAVQLATGITSRDTQAGIKALSRRFAEAAFRSQLCPGFYFDVEFFLVARERGFRHEEGPVTLKLDSEHSTVSALREAVRAARWLHQIRRANRAGWYASATPEADERAAQELFQKISLLETSPRTMGTLPFLHARYHITPYRRIAAQAVGRDILDLGAGHGLLTGLLAANPSHRVTAVEHDPFRATTARSLAPQAEIHVGDQLAEARRLRESGARFDTVYLIDTLHYLPASEQEQFVAAVASILRPGGRVVLREIDSARGFQSFFNRSYERSMTGLGRTRARALHFRPAREWDLLLRTQGLQVRHLAGGGRFPFRDQLWVAEKPAVQG